MLYRTLTAQHWLNKTRVLSTLGQCYTNRFHGNITPLDSMIDTIQRDRLGLFQIIET